MSHEIFFMFTILILGCAGRHHPHSLTCHLKNGEETECKASFEERNIGIEAACFFMFSSEGKVLESTCWKAHKDLQWDCANECVVAADEIGEGSPGNCCCRVSGCNHPDKVVFA